MRRALILALCLILAIGAFLVARGVSDEGGEESASTPATPTQAGAEKATSTTQSQTTPTATPAPVVKAFAIRVRDGRPVGGEKTLTVKKDERVRIVVRADAAGEGHLHGYELERTFAPGKPAVFAFRARIDGAFELETHAHPPLKLAELQVSP
jgi:hypothetical protein